MAMYPARQTRPLQQRSRYDSSDVATSISSSMFSKQNKPSCCSCSSRSTPLHGSYPHRLAGWTVRDQVSHLADTEVIARQHGDRRPRAAAKETARLGGTVVDAGIDAGRPMDAAELLRWWRDAAAANRSALAWRT